MGDSPTFDPALRRGDRRLPALDGMRGIAILFVLWFHFLEVGYPRILAPVGFFLYNFGWIGVDLFFVLSGFLITGILLEAKGMPNYFKNFYMRRALRIFPAYYLLLLIMLVIVPAFAPQIFPATYGPRWCYFLYLSNYYYAYQGTSAGTLSHSWSLAVEEQFYLFWPALVLLCSRRRLLQISAGMFFGALILRFIFLSRGANNDQVYFMSITRCDSLAIGAIVAILVRSSEGVALIKKHSLWIAVASVLALGVLWGSKRIMPTIGHLTEEAAKFTCVALFCAAFIGISVVSSEKTLMNRLLRTRFLRFFGKYSYGFYLFQGPLYLSLKQYLGPANTAGQMLFDYLIFFLGTIVLGLLSWHLMEKHVLRLKHFFPSPSAARDTLKAPIAPAAESRDVLI
jgi:peptidoglycan/LPS O-acetylase OafA/YrhL